MRGNAACFLASKLGEDDDESELIGLCTKSIQQFS